MGLTGRERGREDESRCKRSARGYRKEAGDTREVKKSQAKKHILIYMD